MLRPRSIIVRSTSSTASGSSVTRCCEAARAARKLGNWQMPSASRGRVQRSEVVAADAAELLGEAGGDLLGLPRADRAQALDQVGDAGGHVATPIVRLVGEAAAAAIGQQRV